MQRHQNIHQQQLIFQYLINIIYEWYRYDYLDKPQMKSPPISCFSSEKKSSYEFLIEIEYESIEWEVFQTHKKLGF